MLNDVVENRSLAEDEDLEAQLAYENLKRRREARRRKRIITIVMAVGLVLVGIIVFVMQSGGQDAQAQDQSPLAATAMVYSGEFATKVSANGATEPVSAVVVTPEVDGIIENLSVEEGSHVEKGDLLFTLKNDKLDKAIREAESQLRSAQRTVETDDQAVDDAYNAYNKAVDECNQSGDWSAFDEASLRSAITAAENQYETAKDALETAQATLDEAKREGEKRSVYAPASGSVVALNAQNGAGVGSETGNASGASGTSGPLVKIADLGTMKVTVQVNEVDISTIQEGQKATATFAALPGVSLDATVQRIASSASSSGAGTEGGGSGGVVTYAVDLLIPKPDEQLKPGMTATVTITTQNVPNALIVPTSALNGEEGAEQYVTVVEDQETGQTRDVPVTVIQKNSSEAAVKGELADGDMVLLGGAEVAGAEASMPQSAEGMG
ncbi:MAG: efflux RND transporter periplasmic adaptor subunit [Coriobacteriales bacterium]|nr:efflux RND transporter periplasmic adaptor subunit [Coriobacteriales bacterium]